VQTAAPILAGRGFASRIWLEGEATDITSWLLESHVQRMREAGLTGLQGQAHRAQPWGDLVLAALDHRVLRLEEHAIIGVDHDVGRREAAAFTAGKLRA
jgi:hypothetical protein